MRSRREGDQNADVVDEQSFVNAVATELSPKYSTLISLRAQQHMPMYLGIGLSRARYTTFLVEWMTPLRIETSPF